MILLFGGAGQLGRELTALATERAMAVTAVAHAEADICDLAAVSRIVAAIAPGIVVNAAAYTDVDKAETDVEAAIRANRTGPAVLAQVCAEHRRPLVHISTDYVFDGAKPGAYVEADPVSPLNVYGRTKAAGEAGVRERHAEHLILRTSWLYGRFGRNALKTALRLAAERDELRFVNDQRGCPTATLDVARAILHVAPRLAAREPAWGTYHLAGVGVTTWHGFVEHVVAAQAPFTGRRPAVVGISSAELGRPARRPPNSELDSRRFERVFGFRAEPWQDMVAWTVERLLAPAPDGTADDSSIQSGR
jgi:dTDP-4-dehydrorhamnose reductase